MARHSSLSTPNNPKANGVTFFGSVEIDCPASLAWAVLKDFPSYSAWNTFSPAVNWPTSTPGPGDEGILTLRFGASDAGTKHPIKLIALDDSRMTVEWTGIGVPRWVLSPERVQKVEKVGKGKCRFTSYETMQGPIQGLVNLLLGDRLDRGHERMGLDMKRWIESGDFEKVGAR
ncbi:MAG: hypothetical protein TREMPRED_000642 [Tremellales sp. Tagirdzhanova-0007]|nr:MAG: hypothetical protein TREMPRED_000642 [Tremellales sp. Tagirdzhanova-0007]